MGAKNSKINLTKEMKAYFLTSISKGYVMRDEFAKVLGIDIFIGDVFSQMRKNNGITVSEWIEQRFD